MVYDQIRSTASQRPRMYGLNGVYPLRHFLSMVGSVQHELAKWLADLLQPVSNLFPLVMFQIHFGFSVLLEIPICFQNEGTL